MVNEMTDKEAEEILRNFGDSKATPASFFTKVIQTEDTTKTGNVNEQELGVSKLPVRTYKELATFSKDIAGQDLWHNYFNKMAEIQLSTGLSKDALLLRLFNTVKKELADVTPQRKENTGWFKKKETQPATA